MRLTEVDDLLRPDHWYLEESDDCYFLREYISGGGYGAGETNNLISNLQKGPSASPHERAYRQGAIRRIARELEAVVDYFPEESCFVPIPPSKARGHEEYDDRLTAVLTRVEGLETCELLLQTESTPQSKSGDRRSPSELVQLYRVEDDICTPRQIVIFDDILTTGSHFKAAQQVLTEAFQGVQISGLFVARVVRPTVAEG